MFFKNRDDENNDNVWDIFDEEKAPEKKSKSERIIMTPDKNEDAEINKKNSIFRISNLFFLIAGLLMLYLLASRIQLARLNMYTLDNYINDANKLKTSITRSLSDKKYNEKLKNGEFLTGKKPDFDKAEKDDKENSLYNRDIKVNSNIPDPIGVIYIPKIDIYYPIYEGTSPWVLDNGVGIMEKTSMPGGNGTNCVLTAHRGTQNGDFFRHLDLLSDGDVYYIVYNGDVLKYSVVGTDVVAPSDTSKITIEENKDKTTLLTCTPYLRNTERLLKHGERVKLGEGEKEYVIDKIKNITVPGYKRFFNNKDSKIKDKNYNLDNKSIKDSIISKSGKIFTITIALSAIITAIFLFLKNRRSK